MTPAQRLHARTTAKRGAALSPAFATGYERMLMKLAHDKRLLHEIASFEKRAEIKRGLLPDYQPWVDGVLAAAKAPDRDDVFMTALTWLVDIGDLQRAIPLFAYALRHALPMPEQYKRDCATFVVEQAAEAALASITAKAPVDVAALTEIRLMTLEEDMPDEVRAKLEKALGLALGETAGALSHLRAAFKLNPKCGVKKDIERLERRLAS